MINFGLLNDDIIHDIVEYVIIEDISDIGTRCKIIEAFVCSSKKIFNMFRTHEEFVEIQALLKIMMVYVKAYDERMGQSDNDCSHEDKWMKSISLEKWESDFQFKHNISRPIYVDYGNYFITNSEVLHGWSYGLVNFNNHEKQIKYLYEYQYQGDDWNITKVHWCSKKVVLGFANEITTHFDGELIDLFDKTKISDARDARDVLKGVTMYVLSRESLYEDIVDVQIILPGGTKFLELMADCMISYIQNTTRFETFVEKIPIIFDSEEKGYIRSGPYVEHPLENYRYCHYHRTDDHSDLGYEYGNPNSHNDCDCPSCTKTNFRVVIEHREERFPEDFLHYRDMKIVRYLPN